MEFIKSKFFSSRRGNKPSVIVLHTMLGTMKGSITWFQSWNNKGRTSAHYLIGKDGRTVQMVEDKYAAHHAGIVHNPSESAKRVLKKGPWWRSFMNPNYYTIGIEIESKIVNGVVENLTGEQLKALTKLVRDIGSTHGIVLDNNNIITHQDISSYKPNLMHWKKLLIEELYPMHTVNGPHVEMFTRGTSTAVYAILGNVAVPFAVSWDEYVSEYPNHSITKLSVKDFDKRFKKSRFNIRNSK